MGFKYHDEPKKKFKSVHIQSNSYRMTLENIGDDLDRFFRVKTKMRSLWKKDHALTKQRM